MYPDVVARQQLGRSICALRKNYWQLPFVHQPCLIKRKSRDNSSQNLFSSSIPFHTFIVLSSLFSVTFVDSKLHLHYLSAPQSLRFASCPCLHLVLLLPRSFVLVLNDSTAFPPSLLLPVCITVPSLLFFFLSSALRYLPLACCTVPHS